MTTWIVTSTNKIQSLLNLVSTRNDTTICLNLGSEKLCLGDNIEVRNIGGATVPIAVAPTAAQQIALDDKDIVVAADGSAERMVAGLVAAKHHLGVYSGVSALTADTFTVQRYGGISQQEFSIDAPIVILCEGGEQVQAQCEDSSSVTAATIEPSETYPISVVGTHMKETETADLVSAKRIVAVGRGFKQKEDLDIATQLAQVIGAELGCSRPIVEGSEWMEHDRYIGISGQHVHPDVYVAIGISGQLQHMSGAREAKTIIAINNDKEAPIMKACDYGVVGDLYQVVPQLTDALKKNG